MLCKVVLFYLDYFSAVHPHLHVADTVGLAKDLFVPVIPHVQKRTHVEVISSQVVFVALHDYIIAGF